VGHSRTTLTSNFLGEGGEVFGGFGSWNNSETVDDGGGAVVGVGACCRVGSSILSPNGPYLYKCVR